MGKSCYSSLALLFYQDVPEERFHEFMKPYRDCVLKKNWKLQNETFTVENLPGIRIPPGADISDWA